MGLVTSLDPNTAAQTEGSLVFKSMLVLVRSTSISPSVKLECRVKGKLPLLPLASLQAHLQFAQTESVTVMVSVEGMAVWR